MALRALDTQAGTLLRPPEIAVAASVGRARLQVGRQPVIHDHLHWR